MADLKSFINTSSDRIKSAMGVPVDRVKTIQGSKLNQDGNADAYILAEGITDANIKKAITQLVKDLKAINAVQANFVNFDDLSLSNRKAIYPFPGTGAANRRNLLNPADSDSAYRLVYSNTPTISEKGVNFTSNRFANTKFTASSLDINDCEFDIVLTSSGAAASNQSEFGAYGGSGSVIMQANDATMQTGYIGSSQVYAIPSITGFFEQTQREGTAAGKMFINKDGNKAFNTGVIAGTLPAIELYIGGVNVLGRYSSRTFGWCGIGKSINSLANDLYYAAIGKYNYTLNRMPLTNVLFEGHSFFASNTCPAQISTNLNAADYRTCGFKSLAVAGNKISDMVARIATADTFKKSIPGIPIKNVEIIWIGANETNTDGVANYNALAAYMQTQSAKGWHFIVVTMTPITTSVLPAWRNDFNNNIRNNTANIPNYHVVDTDLHPELCDPTNATYFDAAKLHPIAAGYLFAATDIATILKTL